VAASSAHAALFFLFAPTTADVGAVVKVRLGGTPARFEPTDAERPFQNGIRLYLVPSDIAGDVRSRFDERLHFVGRIVPDRRFRAVLRFRVPPLDTGSYAVASWCPGCARYSFGQSFFVQSVPRVSRFRHLMGLRVRMPAATKTCPVSGGGRYGNDFLSTLLPVNGILVARLDPDGTLFQKLGWVPRSGFDGELFVRGERLDAPGQMRVITVRRGYASNGTGSWATAVDFPSEGCWRITGRVRDISLSYVVKVVAAP
jgi:hypothetical protein